MASDDDSRRARTLMSFHPLEEPSVFPVVHGGLEYAVEAIPSERWKPEWGEPLKEDTHVRIVFLRNRGRVPKDDVKDTRIVVCIPAAIFRGRRIDLTREIRTLRETRAVYLTQPDLETSMLRRSLEKEERSTEDRLIDEERRRYSRGQLVVRGGLNISPQEIFGTPEPWDWLQALARRLLEWVYPTTLVDSSLLPRAVTAEDIPPLYRAVMQPSEENLVLTQLGPALGLSKPDAPADFAPADCKAFSVIEKLLDDAGGQLAWTTAHLLLCHSYGLPAPLSTLYLLLFVRYHRRPVELLLAPGHDLSLVEGRSIPGDRLTPEIVGLLPWPGDLRGRVEEISRPTEISWNSALSYLSVLAPELAPIKEDEEYDAQHRLILETLATLRNRLSTARRLIDNLAKAIHFPKVDDVITPLDRLDQLCCGRDFRQVYRLARSQYITPSELATDLDLLKRLEALGDNSQRILETYAYLSAACIPLGYRELEMDRVALIQQLDLSSLLQEPSLWTVVESRFDE